MTMGWMLMLLGGLAGALAGGGFTYATMMVREKIVVDGAVKAEKNRGTVTCNARVGEIERVHNIAVDKAVEDAVAAATAVPSTPETPAEIVELCKRSASCRERSQ